MSTTAVSQSHLDANVAALGVRNADLAEMLRRVVPPPGLAFTETRQGVPAAALDGRQLCSRHRPLEEARRLVDNLDLIEHATHVVLGFGLGYHVQELVQRVDKAGLVIVFEPDLRLLRAVFDRIDHSAWMKDALLLFMTDPDDRGVLGRRLEGAESILAQGISYVDHPASRHRIADECRRFASMFSDYVQTSKTLFMTTLMRSVDTVRNLLSNLPQYAAGATVHDLKNIAAGYPAIVVAAGPSLQRNIHLLRETDARGRAVIIAVQTALKPLLAAGIKPHFVTALDFHEISKRCYENLTAEDLDGVTLVIDPKAHPAIVQSYEGAIRSCAAPLLDEVLGDMKRPMGDLPAGATVAHLAVYLARYLGCNPITLIGQDLGFSDGVYYPPRVPIHDVWSVELNPFNTLAMMEWQRIVRHRLHLKKIPDIHGRQVYSDGQMLAYLAQFERDFKAYADEGLTILDASEGGAAKQHTTVKTLHAALRQYAIRPLPELPVPPRELDPQRLDAVRERLRAVRKDIGIVANTSRKTVTIIRQMMDDQQDHKRMEAHFRKIEQHRATIGRHFHAFEMLNHLNQLGVFKRLKADRRIHFQEDALEPIARQRLQLERDLENVIWTADAADEMLRLLGHADRLLTGESDRALPADDASTLLRRMRSSASRPDEQKAPAAAQTVGALVPIDPHVGGMGLPRRLDDSFGDVTVLQATLQRLARTDGLREIILLCPDDFDVDPLIDRAAINADVIIERCGDGPYPLEHRAIACARRFSPTCWRGGLAGLGAYDELLCPQHMHRVMEDRALDAALLVGPDWPLVDPSSESGCGAVIERFRTHPEQLSMVFTQAPPGLCGCIVGRSLMGELAARNRLATIGGLLIYQPHAPQGDPVALEMNVQIDHRVRQASLRAVWDTRHDRDALRHALGDRLYDASCTPLDVVDALRQRPPVDRPLPRELLLEINTERTARGVFAEQTFGDASRLPMSLDAAQHVFRQVREVDDLVLTIGGAGDPLLHPDLPHIIRAARAHNLHTIRVRTELRCDTATIDALLDAGVDVISVDVNADRTETYQRMMGADDFATQLENMEYLLAHRTSLTGQTGSSAIALPWIVPHIQRRVLTIDDIEPFFDRWMQIFGTAVIDAAPDERLDPAGTVPALLPAIDPPAVMWRTLIQRMLIQSDGTVPVSEIRTEHAVGNTAQSSLVDLWTDLLAARHHLRETHGLDGDQLRTRQA
jgi:hypothetical protein